ncbi:MAG: ImmA/IrrE family metallo-endopeptidase [Rhodocyclaceae bacterium]|nr:MAG: ImmA/IrrE family metallo-endopeptidase [Rhodocyclaceae bacterium]
MDAVELARRSAAALHATAVAAGHDPCHPYAFAVAIADLRGLDVEPTKPGAAILDGGRATLIPKDDLIVHEKRGTDFERAFLVAHEIGHAELGDRRDPTDGTVVNPARSSEPAPIGPDRVDYSRRQRREVQMDLFARELLLPRPVLRDMHVAQGLTATQIAAHFGAPFEVVAQQLLDALLLPRVEPETTPARTRPVRPKKPNKAQIDAAAHRGGPYLLEAGPGTGKTQTLTNRVAGLLEDDIDPRSILVLTYSNKAAGEMAERIAGVDASAAAAMTIGTFHAFGLDLLRRVDPANRDRPPEMIDRAEAVELLENRFAALNLTHYRNLYDPTAIISDILAAISRAQDEVVDATTYAALARAMSDAANGDDAKAKAAARAAEVARVYALYEDLKHERGRLDFGDLVAEPVRLLEADAGLRAALRARYRHVLVDEYQDVNRASVRLLTALCGDGQGLWAVGDARQSIYRFRGASSFNMARFGSEDFPGGKHGRLTTNYRSFGEVVRGFSSFGAGMAVAGESTLHPDRGDGGTNLQLRTVDHKEQQAPAVAEAIAEMCRAGYRYADQAVLCTGNEALADLGRDLELLGVPVLYLGSLFERPEVRDLLAFLSLLCDPRAMGLVRAACGPDRRLTMADLVVVLDHLRDVELLPGAWSSAAFSPAGLTAPARDALCTLAAIAEGFDGSSDPWVVLATVLLDRTRRAAEFTAATDVAQRSAGIAIWQLMNFLRAQPSAPGPHRIALVLDRIRRLVRLRDDRDLRQLPAAAQQLDGVRLMTIHAAKGLEFDIVHLPGMNGDTLPRTAGTPACPPPDGMIAGARESGIAAHQAAHAEEQECLFYVAVSRARDRLIAYAPTKKSNGTARPQSPFLDRLGKGLERRHVAPALTVPASVHSAPVELAFEGGMSFSGAQLALYEACPRRFFYTHVLRIGGRRTESAYMRMHEAVRTVVEAVIEAPETGEAAALEIALTAAFVAHDIAGPDHQAYRDLAVPLVTYFLSTRHGHVPEQPVDIAFDIDGDTVVVRADDLLMHADGQRRFRRVRTGHKSSKEHDDIGAAALLLAAQQAFPGVIVELIHLADGVERPVIMSQTVLRNRRAKLAQVLGGIRAGNFPAVQSQRTCPRCPAFFVCGPLPDGLLTRRRR